MPELTLKFFAMVGATVLAIATAIWAAGQFVNTQVGLISANASEIVDNSIGDLEHRIRISKRIRRDLRREAREYPDDLDLAEDIEELDDDIDILEAELQCLRDGGKSC